MLTTHLPFGMFRFDADLIFSVKSTVCAALFRGLILSNNKKLQAALAAVLVVLFGAVIYLGYQALQPPGYGDLGEEQVAENRTPREPFVSPRTDGEIAPGSGNVIAGGVERPATDLDGSLAEGVLGDPLAGTELDYGDTPAVPADANASVALAAEAVRTGRYPERLSAAHASPSARSFDPRKFDANSEAFDEAYRDQYVMTPEPGRVWHPAQPGPGVRRIRALMPTFVKADQGEAVTLRVSGEPGQPVTFTSFDLGQFENQLTTMTVVADSGGVAEVAFVGPPGTVDDVNIVAASPVMSGQVRLTVHVIGPNDPGFGSN